MKFLHNLFLKTWGKKNFTIPEGVVVDGFVYTNLPGQIGGTINGDFFATADLSVLKTGTINGNIEAWDVTVSGIVNGSITCNRTVTLQPECRVQGNVSAPEIIGADTLIKGIIQQNINTGIVDVQSHFLLKETRALQEAEEKEGLKEAEAAAIEHAEELYSLEASIAEPPIKKSENWF